MSFKQRLSSAEKKRASVTMSYFASDIVSNFIPHKTRFVSEAPGVNE